MKGKRENSEKKKDFSPAIHIEMQEIQQFNV